MAGAKPHSALGGVKREGDSQGYAGGNGARLERLEWKPQGVSEDVGDECSEDADQHDSRQ